MSVRRAIVWTFSAQVIGFAASFATMIALARLLTPREIGIYAIGLAVTGVLQAISAFGIGTFVVREEVLDDATIATAFTINGIIALLLGAVIVIASWTPVMTGGEPEVGQVLRLLALVPVIGALEFRPATMLQRDMRFGVLSAVTAARTIANAICTIGAALAGASSLSSAYGGLAYAVVGAAGFTLAARQHARLDVSIVRARAMIAFGLQTLSIGGVSTMAARLSDVVLGRILGLAALGFYSRASALANVLFQNVYGSAAKVLLVKLSDDRRGGRGLRDGYLGSLEVIAGLMWPMLAGVAVLAGPLVGILFGERWLPAAVPLSILMIVQLLSLTFAMHHELFVLNDRVGVQARLEVVRSLLGLAVFAYGCTWGLVGAAVARLADSLLGMALFLPRLPELSGASATELRRLYVRNLVLAAATAAPALALMASAGWRADVPVWQVLAAIGCGGLLWLGVLRLSSHGLWREIERLLGRRFQPPTG